jgi:peptide/nickel transport system ATP-binding protein
MVVDKSDKELVLDIQSITFWYQKDKPIYEDFSLQLHRGECIGIVGASGSGKSTLFELIANNLNPKNGKIEHKNIGWVFQDPYSSFHPSYKILEQINDVSGKSIEELGFNLARLNLKEELLFKLPHQLSGGELQRCSILRALSMEPDILLCDEATSALDNITALNTMKLLIGLLDSVGILLITHDLDLAKWACDYIIKIDEKRYD